MMIKQTKTLVGCSMTVGILIAVLTTFANAATYTVTTAADTFDGICDSQCSFRDAVRQVNLNRGATVHRIEFTSLFDTPQTIVLSQPARFDYGSDFELIGRGNRTTTFTTIAGADFGAFEVNSEFARLFNVRFADNSNSQGLSALYGNDGGDVIVDRCLFENNVADGGAINISANTSVIIRDSTFRNNSSPQTNGGAVFLENFQNVIERSTFDGNFAQGAAAVYLDGISNLTVSTITNCTFTNNEAINGAIILNIQGALSMLNITVYGNTATTAAVDGADFGLTSTTIANSLVGQNGAANLGPTVIQGGPNRLGTTVGVGPLANNGGETETMALLPGSPAIDGGPTFSVNSVDQRGAVRPGGSPIDLGAFETGTVVTTAATGTGTSVTTILTGASVTFPNVSSAGTTSQIPIDPATAGTLPGGFSFGSGFPAYQITTTAQYSAPLTVCFVLSPFTTEPVFNSLTLFHSENGALVDRTISRDFPTRTICAQTDTLSPFAIAQNMAPTAANVSIGGRVLSARGRAVNNALVTLTLSDGDTRVVRTNGFGRYLFEDIEAGQTVIISVSAKGATYEPRLLTASEDLAEVDLFPVENVVRRYSDK